jgi:hypothetical protein
VIFVNLEFCHLSWSFLWSVLRLLLLFLSLIQVFLVLYLLFIALHCGFTALAIFAAISCVAFYCFYKNMVCLMV